MVHYLNPAFYRDTLLGGPVLDTSQPQSLVYANTPKGAVLVAAMYITTPRGATRSPVAASPSGMCTPTCAFAPLALSA